MCRQIRRETLAEDVLTSKRNVSTTVFAYNFEHTVVFPKEGQVGVTRAFLGTSLGKKNYSNYAVGCPKYYKLFDLDACSANFISHSFGNTTVILSEVASPSLDSHYASGLELVALVHQALPHSVFTSQEDLRAIAHFEVFATRFSQSAFKM
jgi:hypothetical protein